MTKNKGRATSKGREKREPAGSGANVAGTRAHPMQWFERTPPSYERHLRRLQVKLDVFYFHLSGACVRACPLTTAQPIADAPKHSSFEKKSRLKSLSLPQSVISPTIRRFFCVELWGKLIANRVASPNPDHFPNPKHHPNPIFNHYFTLIPDIAP